MSAVVPLTKKSGNRLFVVLLAICLSVPTLIGCAQHPNLVVQDESVASWIVTCNSFANASLTNPAAPGRRAYWTGILMQMGTHLGSDWGYDGVLFSKDGRPVEEDLPFLVNGKLSRTQFAWINMVSLRPSGAAGEREDAVPIEVDHAYLLYPNHVVSTVCDEIDDCANGDAPCPGGANIPGKCVRGRKIHGSLEPRSILTYWQERGGLQIDFKQEVGTMNLHNRQEFRSKGPFQIEVYLKGDDDLLTLQHIFKPGDVDLVTVKALKEGPGNGGKQEPPWPPTSP